QLTRSGDTVGSMAISPDSRTLVFTTSGTEGGRPVNSIWSIGLDGDRQSRVTQSSQQTTGDEEAPPARFGGMGGGFQSLQFTRDGGPLFYRHGEGIYAVAFTAGTGMGGQQGGEATATGRTPEGPPAGATGGRGGAGAGATARRINFTAKVEVDHRAERK